MSIIGPRPHMYTDCKKFAEILPGYKFRNMVKPGLTGLAQVKGYHGPAATRHMILMRYHWDSYYIHHMGWMMDIKIILYTVFQRFTAIGRYLVERTQPEKTGTGKKIFN
jgi:putative colanic acid biosynthesis UDP-glucose lipid carrier transferase